MKSLGQLSSHLNKWSKKVEQKLIEAEQNTAKRILEDTVNSAPMRSGEYISSIQVGKTTVQDHKINTQIYTDLLVGGENPKWSKIPLGCLIEWGTGIVGSSSNTYPHGYSYRLTPWKYYDKYLHMFVVTNGMVARPHFYPSLLKNKQAFIEEIRKAVKAK